jgi:hypothetical protein
VAGYKPREDAGGAHGGAVGAIEDNERRRGAAASGRRDLWGWPKVPCATTFHLRRPRVRGREIPRACLPHACRMFAGPASGVHPPSCSSCPGVGGSDGGMSIGGDGAAGRSRSWPACGAVAPTATPSGTVRSGRSRSGRSRSSPTVHSPAVRGRGGDADAAMRGAG